MQNSQTLPNDEFGYSVYTLVALANANQVAKIDGVRTAIGLTRATIQAHVTVRGTFSTIESLDGLRDLLRQTASENHAVSVVFGADGWSYFNRGTGRNSGIMPCDTTPELLDLHSAFDRVIRPISTNQYPDNYRAHMTLCQDCSEDQIEQARVLAADLDIGAGFDIESVQLMGRVGPAFGGEWKMIDSFPLKS